MPEDFDPAAELRKLAEDNPLTSSTEGLDDDCFYCGGMGLTSTEAEHRDDCVWVRARAFFGIT